jgi:uncharacterized protein (TIGR02266 family)
VGRPIVFTTITLCLGFGVLLFSHFIPTIIFGFLILASLFAALWSDLLLLPIILIKVQFVTLWDLLIVRMGKDFYRRIPVLQNLSRYQARALIAASYQEHYQPWEVICRQEEIEDTLFLILEGKVEVRFSSEKRTMVVAQLSEGEVFGEMGLFRGGRRSATVVAMEPTHLIHISDESLNRLVKISPGLASKIYGNMIQILSNRLEQANVSLIQCHWLTTWRYHRRFEKRIKVIWVSDELAIEGVTEDISEGGAFIATSHFLPQQDIIHLEFKLEGEDPPIRCRGRVAWISRLPSGNSPSGFGVEFVNMDKASLKRLLEFYECI